jgi:hypothetical protein
MLNALLVPVALLLGAQAPSVVVAPQNCVKTPFQVTSHVDLPSSAGLSRFTRGAVSIRVPASPVEIQQVDIRLINPNVDVIWLASAQVTIQLNGGSITHGIEIPFTSSAPTVWAIPSGEADLSRNVTLYADASSQIRFDVTVMVSTGTDIASLEVGFTGQAVTLACWGK